MKLWKRDGIYQYRFQIGGTRVQKSTGTSVKGQAESIAMRAWQEAKERAAGTYIPTLEELRQNWLKAQAGAVSIGHWSNIEKWDACGLGRIKIDRLAKEVVELARERYRSGKGRIGKTRADETVQGWMRSLNLLMNWAVSCKTILALPYEIAMAKPQRRPRKILPLGKVKSWLEAVDGRARNPQVGTAARLMIGLGLRASEAVGARWEWIDWETRTYTPGRLVGGQFVTKGGEADALDLPEWLHDYLLELRGDTARLGLILPWKTVDGQEVPHPAAFCRASIRGANEDVGTQGVTAHRTRGTWITHLLREGTPVKEVQKMARHKNEATTMGYYEDASEVRKEAQKKLAAKMGLA